MTSRGLRYDWNKSCLFGGIKLLLIEFNGISGRAKYEAVIGSNFPIKVNYPPQRGFTTNTWEFIYLLILEWNIEIHDIHMLNSE